VLRIYSVPVGTRKCPVPSSVTRGKVVRKDLV